VDIEHLTIAVLSSSHWDSKRAQQAIAVGNRFAGK
jgi:hypothetical protein